MKILATVDGSKCSEAITPELEVLAQLPHAEFVLLSIASPPHDTRRKRVLSTPVVAGLAAPGGTPILVSPSEIEEVEDQGAAVDRTLSERSDYLRDLIGRLPASATYAIEVRIAAHPASAIIEYAMQYQPDVIVMGTHGTTGMIHRLFGDVAEEVVRSAVAPVLLVHPNASKHRTQRPVADKVGAA